MPWKLKREVYFILLGAIVVSLSIIVLVQNQSVSTELLGSIGLLGGIAMILNALPTNGDNH
jgi:hypothetical protein